MHLKEFVQKILNCMSDRPCNITILTAMEMAHKAWRIFSAVAIENCFKTCRFIEKEWSIGEENPI